jgi:glyoxylase-like metal-dependent hydrolase (beta-lactamase superfamily II)
VTPTYEDLTGTAPRFPFHFRQVHAGPHRNFAYAVGDPVTKQAALVDPVFEVGTLLAAVERDGYTVTHAFVTHGHADHAGGIAEMAKRGVTVVVHESWRGHSRIAAAGDKARFAKDGEQVLVGEVPVQVLHTPGHTREASCFLVGAAGQAQALLGGDTLFVNACGRCDVSDLPADEAERLMFASLRRLKALPGDVRVFPGHYYLGFPSRSLAQQRSENPALAVEDFAVWRGLWFLREYD